MVNYVTISENITCNLLPGSVSDCQLQCTNSASLKIIEHQAWI